jgi:serine/threonine protein phosphatase PrpC
MTRSAAAFLVGTATDIGRKREKNEDRAYADEAAGIFLVVDGMGGRAAGEQAADIAIGMIPTELERAKGPIETRVRTAITAANNEIFHRAQTRPDWKGMACVLTLAVAHEDKLVVGHVGDSRLYLAWTGRLRKLTADHSPVGEREDRGDLTEEEAMRDPLRNVVFRDVGSRPHEPLDEGFIETRTYPFRPDAAFLLCTDGLSDSLTNAAINAVVQRYDGDPQQIAQQLVEAANDAGGQDNISVIFVAGPEFQGSEGRVVAEARARHSVTRMRRSGWLTKAMGKLAWLIAGAVLGAAGWAEVERFLIPAVVGVPQSARIDVDAASPDALRAALRAAKPGSIIAVAPGIYNGPLELRDGVTIENAKLGDAPVLRGLVLARDVRDARIDGLHIEAGDGNGLVFRNSTVEVNDTEITGASGCGIRIEGASQIRLRADSIHDNQCGLMIEGASSVRLTGSRIAQNRTAFEIHVPGQLSADGNSIDRNGTVLAGDDADAVLAGLRQHNEISGGTPQ